MKSTTHINGSLFRLLQGIKFVYSFMIILAFSHFLTMYKNMNTIALLFHHNLKKMVFIYFTKINNSS